MTVGIGWGRGGGKSWFLRLVWYLLVAHWDTRVRPLAPSTGVRIVLIMADLQAAKRVHADLMLAELAEQGQWGFLGGRVDRTNWRVRFPGGSWIQWVSAEQALSIKGMRCDVICIDECDQVDKDAIDTRAGPWLTEQHSLSIRIIVGTPERGRFGLLYRTWARANGKVFDNNGQLFVNHAFSLATSYEFPHFIPRTKLDRERAEMVPQLFEREYLCNWDASEGLVYPHFRDDFHVVPPHPDTIWREYIVGVDFGFNDPAIIDVFGVAGSGRDIQLHQVDEFVLKEKTDSQLADVAKRVEALYPKARWYADPSRPQTIESLRREARVNIQGADHSLEDGLATVADALLVRTRPDGTQWAQLYVHPRCVHTVREYGEYRWKRDPKNRDSVIDRIEDKNNHSMDATRYAIFTHFGGIDRRMRTGYEVS
jgi:phage terminase large subunit